LAEIGGGKVARLGEPVTLRTNDHDSFEQAWAEFGSRAGEPLPDALAIAFAGPIGDELKLTNSDWVIRPAVLAGKIGVSALTIVNDFGAVAHAVAVLDVSAFRHVCGPDVPLPRNGVTTIVGPGTGLGVAALQWSDGAHRVIETEGGHIDFAPLDDVEDEILARLRGQFGRVSVERLVSGAGLAKIAGADGRDDKALWHAALDGSDPAPAAALDRFCRILGAVAGDLALAQGANAVVIAGGLGLRLADVLPQSGFCERFAAKGRFRARMQAMPVKLVTYPQPGLLGAAAAFAEEHG
jgi:glucokinase